MDRMDRHDEIETEGGSAGASAAPAPAPAPDDKANPAANAPRKKTRRRLFLILGLVVLLGAVAYGVWYFMVSANFQTTDDAYVDASTASINPQVNGTVISAPVNDTMRVKAGDVLAVLDPADAQLAVAQAEAMLAQATSRVKGYFANVDGAKAEVASREADVKRAQDDYNRREGLADSGAVSGDEVTAAKNALDNAKAGLSSAQQKLAGQLALVEGTDLTTNPDVKLAQAALDKAKLDLARTTIRAPINGIVAQNQIQLGQRVSVGQPLMVVVPIGEAHVNANFKEVQLELVHPGQVAELTSDLYGSDVVFHGKVEGLGGGTGAAFSVIPAQNATGNWIKVVQRLPVRISLDPKELEAHPLRVGLSMNVSIDIRQK